MGRTEFVRWAAALVAIALLLEAGLWLSRSTPVVDPATETSSHDDWEPFSQRCASDSLRTLSMTVEAEPERHGCGGNGFWEGEVIGIYRFNGETGVLSDEETPP